MRRGRRNGRGKGKAVASSSSHYNDHNMRNPTSQHHGDQDSSDDSDEMQDQFNNQFTNSNYIQPNYNPRYKGKPQNYDPNYNRGTRSGRHHPPNPFQQPPNNPFQQQPPQGPFQPQPQPVAFQQYPQPNTFQPQPQHAGYPQPPLNKPQYFEEQWEQQSNQHSNVHEYHHHHHHHNHYHHFSDGINPLPTSTAAVPYTDARMVDIDDVHSLRIYIANLESQIREVLQSMADSNTDSKELVCHYIESVRRSYPRSELARAFAVNNGGQNGCQNGGQNSGQKSCQNRGQNNGQSNGQSSGQSSGQNVGQNIYQNVDRNFNQQHNAQSPDPRASSQRNRGPSPESGPPPAGGQMRGAIARLMELSTQQAAMGEAMMSGANGPPTGKSGQRHVRFQDYREPTVEEVVD
ncbi:uncharacterized protein GGS22DRAFT_188435 [Annulohypoxylon maeteangense]|uniref:uncharacterized protein n=1 Tax=Annulohypoxylon maeteangense TaxID=1927788 RepID=UPI002008AB31|nr:uncharacterized protein GGS22DRAFT_188435 [Annulohypoxylon maeteangense]KAI0885143.1 hypothetical protein GGS22DRAFT_188435 [Annulohypoxylon maeteangense]